MTRCQRMTFAAMCRYGWRWRESSGRRFPEPLRNLVCIAERWRRYLNRLFADRTLYLFDTFQGFSQNDLADGTEGKHSQAEAGDFQDTNLELVLSRLPYPEKAVVRKGYFPETAEGLEDRFALVSLDVADLYKLTLSGLEYFIRGWRRWVYFCA